MAKYWPEPREQLHGGGEKMTEVMELELKVELLIIDSVSVCVMCSNVSLRLSTTNYIA